VTVYDVLGIAIPTVPPDRIGITCTAGSPLVTPPAASTDDKGRTTGTIVGRALGTGDVLVSVAGILLDDQPSLSFVPGPPANITVQVLNRRLVVGGDTTTVIADVTDKSGNPTEDGTAVIFQANDGSFIPSAATTVAGRATSLFYSGVTAGDATFTVTASRRGGEASEDVANITFLPGPPFNISIIADQYAVQAGSTNELTITALDQYGNTVDRNSRLNLSVDPSGNGSIAPLSVYTDEKGSATASYTAGTVAGDTAHVVVQDVSGSVTVLSPLFVFQPALPGNIIMVASADTVTVGSPVTMTVNVEDSYGNPSSDTTLVVFSRNPLLGTLNPSAVNTSGGVASTRLSGVTQAGDVEVSATAGNVVGSARVYFAAGGLVELSVVAVPAQIGVGKSTTITVTARDAYGNPVSGALIDFAISFDPGGCSLQHAQRTTGRSGTASTIFTAGGVTGSAVVTVTWDDDPAIEASTFIDIQ